MSTFHSSSNRELPKLNPHRIKLARQRRGLTKTALARALGVTSRTLTQYESEGAPNNRANDLATHLGMKPSFFTFQDPVVVSGEQAFFRARRRSTSAELGAARAVGTLGIELYGWITTHFSLPEVEVPDLDGYDPVAAASALRAFWGYAAGPLPNLIQLAESKGIRVICLPTDADNVDAFSFWHDEKPYALLSMDKTPERSRFDLAHEIGHLVLHSRVSDPSTVEVEADKFAAEFLMPTSELRASASRESAVPEIMKLRSHYRVSAMAMTRKLKDVGRLSDWAYRQNCVYLAQAGFRSAEPGGIQRERSRVFDTVFRDALPQTINLEDVASSLGIDFSELHALTFGQIPALVHSDDRADSFSVAPKLRLIK